MRNIGVMTVDDIFKRYGSATALGEAIGRNPVRAAEMRQRGSIAVAYWRRLVEDAQKRGFSEITYESIAEAHAHVAEERKASHEASAA